MPDRRDRDYGGSDAGYRGGGYLGGDWAGGRRIPEPYGGQSGTMWGPPDPGPVPHDEDIGPPRSFRGLGPKGYRRSDESIREDVCDLLTDDGVVDATDIDVTVSEGVVTLTGGVADRRMKRRAEVVAESVRGVRDVQNQLVLTT